MPIITPSNAKLLTELSEKSTAALTDIIFLYETVNSLPYKLPLSKLGIIIESDSNSNGSWIKFSDGTMIQRGTATVSPTYHTNDKNIGTYGWSFYMVQYASNLYITFPTKFVDKNSYQFLALENGGSTAQPYAENYSANSVHFGCIVPNNVTSVTFSWIAIGRWK